MRILLVEDHQDTLEVLRHFLVLHQHKVTMAATLTEAREQCNSTAFDLVICDIGLPDGDGWELAELAKQCGSKAAIAMTGYGTPSDVTKAAETGFDAHLLKPVIFNDLLDTIARVSRL